MRLMAIVSVAAVVFPVATSLAASKPATSPATTQATSEWDSYVQAFRARRLSEFQKRVDSARADLAEMKAHPPKTKAEKAARTEAAQKRLDQSEQMLESAKKATPVPQFDSDLQIGQMAIPIGLRIVQMLDKNQAIADLLYNENVGDPRIGVGGTPRQRTATVTVLVRGLPIDGKADGSTVNIDKPMKVADTYSYESVGGRRTIFVLVPAK